MARMATESEEQLENPLAQPPMDDSELDKNALEGTCNYIQFTLSIFSVTA